MVVNWYKLNTGVVETIKVDVKLKIDFKLCVRVVCTNYNVQTPRKGFFRLYESEN